MYSTFYNKLKKVCHFSLLVFICSPVFGQKYQTKQFDEPDVKTIKGCPKKAFSSKEGDTPLFLSNEHGANDRHAVRFVPERKGIGVRGFVKKADQYTDQITEMIADEFYRLTGKQPFILIAELPRTQVDFNRPADFAYESNGYLLDVHGQAKFPNHLIRGTRNGETVRELIKREGEIYAGEQGLFGLLEVKGYQIMPKHNGFEEIFRGGFMVQRYGSHNEEGIDAVQIEIGRKYRNTSNKRKSISQAIAQSLVKRFEKLGYISARNN